MEQKRQQAESRFDASTGRTLFQPEVGRAPRGPAKRNAEALPVGEYLYNLRLEAAEKQDTLVQREQAEAQKAAQPKASRHSKVRAALLLGRFAAPNRPTQPTVHGVVNIFSAYGT